MFKDVSETKITEVFILEREYPGSHEGPYEFDIIYKTPIVKSEDIL